LLQTYKLSAAVNYFLCGFPGVFWCAGVVGSRDLFFMRHEYSTDYLTGRWLACAYKQTCPQLAPKK